MQMDWDRRYIKIYLLCECDYLVPCAWTADDLSYECTAVNRQIQERECCVRDGVALE